MAQSVVVLRRGLLELYKMKLLCVSVSVLCACCSFIMCKVSHLVKAFINFWGLNVKWTYYRYCRVLFAFVLKTLFNFYYLNSLFNSLLVFTTFHSVFLWYVQILFQYNHSYFNWLFTVFHVFNMVDFFIHGTNSFTSSIWDSYLLKSSRNSLPSLRNDHQLLSVFFMCLSLFLHKCFNIFKFAFSFLCYLLSVLFALILMI